MRPVKHLALSAWLLLTCSPLLLAQDRIPWVKDLAEARQLAQQHNRLVLLHFWSTDCPPCQRLDQTVFNQPELIRAVAAGFIPAKINVQQSPDLAKFYRVGSVPTDIVVDPSGKEVYRTPSPADAGRYIALLDGLKARYSMGYRTAPNLASQPTIPPSGTLLGSDTRFSPDRPAQSGDFRLPANPFPTLDGSNAAAPAALGMATRSGIVENPYSNAAERERPRDSLATGAAPDTGTAGGFSGSPVATNSVGPASLALSTPNSRAVANPYQSLVPEAARPQNVAGSQNNLPDPTWAPSPGLNRTSAQSYAATPGPTNRWQNPPAMNRSWDTAPGTNVEPGTPPIPPRADSRGPGLPAQDPPLPPGIPPLGLDGYCPVALVDRTKWVKGDPAYGAFHRGRTYLFTSAVEQQQFLANPDRFTPALSGWDLVRYAETGELVEGKREHGVFYRDRIYLFGDEASLQRFGARPDYYVAVLDQAMRQSAAPRTSW